MANLGRTATIGPVRSFLPRTTLSIDFALPNGYKQAITQNMRAIRMCTKRSMRDNHV